MTSITVVYDNSKHIRCGHNVVNGKSYRSTVSEIPVNIGGSNQKNNAQKKQYKTEPLNKTLSDNKLDIESYSDNFVLQSNNNMFINNHSKKNMYASMSTGNLQALINDMNQKQVTVSQMIANMKQMPIS